MNSFIQTYKKAFAKMLFCGLLIGTVSPSFSAQEGWFSSLFKKTGIPGSNNEQSGSKFSLPLKAAAVAVGTAGASWLAYQFYNKFFAGNSEAISEQKKKQENIVLNQKDNLLKESNKKIELISKEKENLGKEVQNLTLDLEKTKKEQEEVNNKLLVGQQELEKQKKLVEEKNLEHQKVQENNKIILEEKEQIIEKNKQLIDRLEKNINENLHKTTQDKNLLEQKIQDLTVKWEKSKKEQEELSQKLVQLNQEIEQQKKNFDNQQEELKKVINNNTITLEQKELIIKQKELENSKLNETIKVSEKNIENLKQQLFENENLRKELVRENDELKKDSQQLNLKINNLEEEIVELNKKDEESISLVELWAENVENEKKNAKKIQEKLDLQVEENKKLQKFQEENKKQVEDLYLKNSEQKKLLEKVQQELQQAIDEINNLKKIVSQKVEELKNKTNTLKEKFKNISSEYKNKKNDFDIWFKKQQEELLKKLNPEVKQSIKSEDAEEIIEEIIEEEDLDSSNNSNSKNASQISSNSSKNNSFIEEKIVTNSNQNSSIGSELSNSSHSTMSNNTDNKILLNAKNDGNVLNNNILNNKNNNKIIINKKIILDTKKKKEIEKKELKSDIFIEKDDKQEDIFYVNAEKKHKSELLESPEGFKITFDKDVKINNKLIEVHDSYISTGLTDEYPYVFNADRLEKYCNAIAKEKKWNEEKSEEYKKFVFEQVNKGGLYAYHILYGDILNVPQSNIEECVESFLGLVWYFYAESLNKFPEASGFDEGGFIVPVKVMDFLKIIKEKCSGTTIMEKRISTHLKQKQFKKLDEYGIDMRFDDKTWLTLPLLPNGCGTVLVIQYEDEKNEKKLFLRPEWCGVRGLDLVLHGVDLVGWSLPKKFPGIKKLYKSDDAGSCRKERVDSEIQKAYSNLLKLFFTEEKKENFVKKNFNKILSYAGFGGGTDEKKISPKSPILEEKKKEFENAKKIGIGSMYLQIQNLLLNPEFKDNELRKECTNFIKKVENHQKLFDHLENGRIGAEVYLTDDEFWSAYSYYLKSQNKEVPQYFETLKKLKNAVLGYLVASEMVEQESKNSKKDKKNLKIEKDEKLSVENKQEFLQKIKELAQLFVKQFDNAVGESEKIEYVLKIRNILDNVLNNKIISFEQALTTSALFETNKVTTQLVKEIKFNQAKDSLAEDIVSGVESLENNVDKYISENLSSEKDEKKEQVSADSEDNLGVILKEIREKDEDLFNAIIEAFDASRNGLFRIVNIFGKKHEKITSIVDAIYKKVLVLAKKISLQENAQDDKEKLVKLCKEIKKSWQKTILDNMISFAGPRKLYLLNTDDYKNYAKKTKQEITEKVKELLDSYQELLKKTLKNCSSENEKEQIKNKHKELIQELEEIMVYYINSRVAEIGEQMGCFFENQQELENQLKELIKESIKSLDSYFNNKTGSSPFVQPLIKYHKKKQQQYNLSESIVDVEKELNEDNDLNKYEN